MRRAFPFSLWICLTACGSSPSTPSEPRASGETPVANAPQEHEAAEADDAHAHEGAVPAETGPAPELGLRLADEGGRVALVVENRGTSVARIAPRMHLRNAEGTARTAPLRASCDAAPPSCVELMPGAVLFPPTHVGDGGACTCGDCESLAPGRYTIGLESCGGAHRIEGPELTVDAS